MPTDGPRPAWPVRFALLATCGALAGCAAQQHKAATREGYAADGTVNAEIVEQADATRYQPMPGSRYDSPLPRYENAKPGYPPSLLARRLPPAAVVVRVIVDATGSVENAEVVENDSSEPAFGDAVLSAVRGWTFIPLKRVTGDRIERLPFTQHYRFTFRQVNGRAVVEYGGGPG